MIKIGILSDTHLTQPSDLFKAHVRACFAEVDMIMHAGDLTEMNVLEVFHGKEVHAVHGNMCGYSSYSALPEKKTIQVGSFSIGLTHGDVYPYNIEERLLHSFDAIDCIIYGHTHKPVCHKNGSVLFINPGSFTLRTRYGKRGTYGILEVDRELRGNIYELGEVE